MSGEESRKSNPGAPASKSSSDDRKSSATGPVGRRIVIKSADMKDDMQKEAIDIAVAAFEKHGVEKDVAEHIKKEFDKKHGPTWHCIVGKNFGNPLPSLSYFWHFSALDLVELQCMPTSMKVPYLNVNQQSDAEGSYVTHETNHFVYFYLDQKAILLFKSG
ncbi:hypothetical protein CDL15_Pgr011338 [Punica granatum]|uniref:Dynein light chain n=1 Tax=Punica granatum TaxID=22663 RepID=A0A218WG53_PUNGR|nr:hypothetical protein CDL15_Pgr011338 [Punica granatum]